MNTQSPLNTITIVGAGAFGFAMAKLLDDHQHLLNVTLYDIDENTITHIVDHKKHPHFHTHQSLSQRVIATSQAKEALLSAEVLILALPTNVVRPFIKAHQSFLHPKSIIVNLSKGLEKGTNLRISQVLEQEGIINTYSCLSGGMIASEVIDKNPLCADLACKDMHVAEQLKTLFNVQSMRLSLTDDVEGVEYAGAFKNVVAIGAGIFDGLGLKESSKSAFILEASKEIESLIDAIKQGEGTFKTHSFSWLGDLLTTCFGDSRNKEFGMLIGQGNSVQQALQTMEQQKRLVEGYKTAHTLNQIMKENQLNLPLLSSIYAILYENEAPTHIIDCFMN